MRLYKRRVERQLGCINASAEAPAAHWEPPLAPMGLPDAPRYTSHRPSDNKGARGSKGPAPPQHRRSAGCPSERRHVVGAHSADDFFASLAVAVRTAPVREVA